MDKQDIKELIAGMIRVAQWNATQGPHVKIHKPTLGPYTAANPKTCMDCGKNLGDVSIGEPCDG